MGMMINRRRAYGSKKLPYDAEIEYLGFAQNCTIDTGINPSTNYKYYWKYLWTDRANYAYVFANNGSRGNWFNFGGIERNGDSNLHIKDSGTQGIALNANTHYEGSLIHNGNNIEVKLNNTLMASLPYKNFQSNINLVIQNIRNIAIWMYNFSIYNENNVLILDFIPVRVGNVGYMYDKVSGTLFGNQGTGSFILGPDK